MSTPSTDRKSAPWRACLILGLFALVVRLIYLFESNDNPFRSHLDLDIRLYHLWAEAILNGVPFGPGPFLQAPLYPFFLAGCYAILGRGMETILILQALLGALTTALGARIACRYWGRTAMISTGLLLALYKPAIFYTGIMLVPSLATTLLATALLLAPNRPAAAGLFTGLTALAHPILLPGALLATLGLTSARRRAVLLVFAGLFAAILPSTIHNFIKSGAFIPISANTGINLYIGNAPSATGFYQPPTHMRGDEDPIGINEASRRVGHSLDAPGASRYWIEQAGDAITDNPVRALKLYLRKLLFTLAAYETPQIESFDFEAAYSILLRLPFFPNWLCLIVIAISGLVICFTDSRLRLFVLATLVTAAFIAIFFVTARFRLPSSLYLALAAGGTISIFLSRLQKRYLPCPVSLLPALGAVILAILLLSPNWFGIERERSHGAYHYRLGVFAERNGNTPEATECYARAITLDDAHARATINLGILSARQGDLNGARDLLQKGISLDPRSAKGLLALGQIHQINQNLQAAIDHYERAWSTDPTLYSSLEFLAAALYLSGNIPETRQRAAQLQHAVGPQAPLTRRCNYILKRIREREALGWPLAPGPDVAAGDLSAAVGDISSASLKYQSALSADPSNLLILLELARMAAAGNDQAGLSNWTDRFLQSGGDPSTLRGLSAR